MRADDSTAGSAGEGDDSWATNLQQDAHVDAPQRYAERGNDFLAEMAERNAVSGWLWTQSYQCWVQYEDHQDHHTVRILNKGPKTVNVKLWAVEGGNTAFTLGPGTTNEYSIDWNNIVNWRWTISEEEEKQVAEQPPQEALLARLKQLVQQKNKVYAQDFALSARLRTLCNGATLQRLNSPEVKQASAMWNNLQDQEGQLTEQINALIKQINPSGGKGPLNDKINAVLDLG